MNVNGWAFTANESQGQIDNQKSELMFVLGGKNDWVIVESTSTGYAYKTYRGYLKEGHPKITLKELLIWLDNGNLCFGGRGNIYANGWFEVTIYTG